MFKILEMINHVSKLLSKICSVLISWQIHLQYVFIKYLWKFMVRIWLKIRKILKNYWVCSFLPIPEVIYRKMIWESNKIKAYIAHELLYIYFLKCVSVTHLRKQQISLLWISKTMTYSVMIKISTVCSLLIEIPCYSIFFLRQFFINFNFQELPSAKIVASGIANKIFKAIFRFGNKPLLFTSCSKHYDIVKYDILP